METNESILTRKVVGIGDRKALGKITGLRVDCDTLNVCHYVVESSSTNSSLALPFEGALSVGDTFLTVQSRGDFLSTSSETQNVVNDGFKLVGVEAYSKTGNKLGTVASFGFDPVFGTVTGVALDEGSSFDADQFVFFAPEFVFVDDGEKTAGELRAEGAAEGDRDEAVKPDETEDVVAEPESADPEEADETEADEPEVAIEEAVEPEQDEETDEPDEDAELVAFLLGMTLTEDVESADGAFTVSKGTVLTQELVDDAREHEALLLLTMSVDA